MCTTLYAEVADDLDTLSFPVSLLCRIMHNSGGPVMCNRVISIHKTVKKDKFNARAQDVLSSLICLCFMDRNKSIAVYKE